MTDNSKSRRPRMAAAAARRASTDQAPAAAGTTAARTKDVRMTVEVPPELHRALTGWARQVMIDTGATRVTISDAVRAMIRLTTTDPDIAARVRELLEP